MQKTVQFGGVDYTVTAITLEQAETIEKETADLPEAARNRQQMKLTVAAATGLTLDEVQKLPFYVTYLPLAKLVNSANGFEVADTPGEAQPGATQAEPVSAS